MPFVVASFVPSFARNAIQNVVLCCPCCRQNKTTTKTTLTTESLGFDPSAPFDRLTSTLRLRSGSEAKLAESETRQLVCLTARLRAFQPVSLQALTCHQKQLNSIQRNNLPDIPLFFHPICSVSSSRILSAPQSSNHDSEDVFFFLKSFAIWKLSHNFVALKQCEDGITEVSSVSLLGQEC